MNFDNEYGGLIVIFCALFCYMGYVRRTDNVTEFHTRDRKVDLLPTSISVSTIIGAPHFTLMTFLSFAFGWYSGMLYLGSFLGFLFLSIVAPRIRSYVEEDTHTYANIADQRGPVLAFILMTGGVLFSFGALVTQIIAGAEIMTSIAELSSPIIPAALIATATTVYLYFGGYRALIFTDVWQGSLAIGLAALLLYLVWPGSDVIFGTAPEVSGFLDQPEPVYVLLMAGFFIELGAPVNWQRIVTAKSDLISQLSMIGGGTFILVGGAIIVLIGNFISSTFPDLEPDGAFIEVIANHLPDLIQGLAVAALLFALISTADSAQFVTSTMISTFWSRRIAQNAMTIPRTQKIILIVGALALLIAIYAFQVDSSVNDAFGVLLMVGYITGPLAFAVVFRRGGRTQTKRRCVFLGSAFLGVLAFVVVYLTKGSFSPWNLALVACASLPLLLPGEKESQSNRSKE